MLAKACRGELVLTEAELARQEGREYEPASVLLERIKQERTTRSANGRAKRGHTPIGATQPLPLYVRRQRGASLPGALSAGAKGRSIL
jgi:type I restriction enzyme S subunit